MCGSLWGKTTARVDGRRGLEARLRKLATLPRVSVGPADNADNANGVITLSRRPFFRLEGACTSQCQKRKSSETHRVSRLSRRAGNDGWGRQGRWLVAFCQGLGRHRIRRRPSIHMRKQVCRFFPTPGLPAAACKKEVGKYITRSAIYLNTSKSQCPKVLPKYRSNMMSAQNAAISPNAKKQRSSSSSLASSFEE